MRKLEKTQIDKTSSYNWYQSIPIEDDIVTPDTRILLSGSVKDSQSISVPDTKVNAIVAHLRIQFYSR